MKLLFNCWSCKRTAILQSQHFLLKFYLMFNFYCSYALSLWSAFLKAILMSLLLWYYFLSHYFNSNVLICLVLVCFLYIFINYRHIQFSIHPNYADMHKNACLIAHSTDSLTSMIDIRADILSLFLLYLFMLFNIFFLLLFFYISTLNSFFFSRVKSLHMGSVKLLMEKRILIV